MAMNTILGNTLIKQWRLEYQFDPAIIKIKKLRETFEVVYGPTKKIVYNTNSQCKDPTETSTASITAPHTISGGVPNVTPSILKEKWCS